MSYFSSSFGLTFKNIIPEGRGPGHSTGYKRAYGTLFLVASLVLAAAFIAPMLSRAAAPTVAGGFPDLQESAPLDARLDMFFSETIQAADATDAAKISLQTCSGSTAASPGTCSGSNLCATSERISGGGGTNNGVLCNPTGNLTLGTVYRFTVQNIRNGGSETMSPASATRTFKTGTINPASNTTPPRVQQTTPPPGAEHPISANLFIEFPLGPEGNMNFNTGMGSVAQAGDLNFCQNNSCAVSIKKIENNVPTTEQCTSATACVFGWDTTNRRLTVNPASNLTASTAGAQPVEYDLCVRGGGNPLAVKNSANQSIGGDHCMRFRTSSGAADATAPTILTSDPPPNATNISSLFNAWRMNLSETPDCSTVTTANVRIFKDADSNGVFGGSDTDESAKFDIACRGQEKAIVFGLKTELTAGRHCYQLMANGLKDTSGNAAAAAVPSCYTIVDDTDAVAPKLDFCDMDSFKAVCRYTEPVNKTQAETVANYTLACGTTADTRTTVNLTGKTFSYNPAPGIHEVTITGLGLTTGQNCRMTIGTGITDIAGNNFSVAGDDEFEDAFVQNAAITGGSLGTAPPAGGDFFGGGTAAGFWENPQRAEPRTKATSKNTNMEVEFKAPDAMPIGSKIILTFPAGFTLCNDPTAPANCETTGATQIRVVPGANSFMNVDINGPAASVPTVSVAATTDVDPISGTVTLTTAGGAIAASDRLRFELDRVSTPAVAQTGVRITIVIKALQSGSLIKIGQTIQPAPFDIATGGALSIAGTVCRGTSVGGACAGGDTGIAAKVVCEQRGGFLVGTTASAFMGRNETTAASNGTWTISGLTGGDYECFVPPDPIVLADIGGISPFQRVSLTTSNKTGVDFKFKTMTAGGAGVVTLTVNVSGGPASEVLDVFCHAGSSDYEFSAPVMKTLTLNGSGATGAGATPNPLTMNLQQDKTYECGIGPSMIGKFTPGEPPPVPTFNFMPPRMQRVLATGTPSVTFVLKSNTRTITATLLDGSSAGIANAFVHANPVGCFGGTNGAVSDCHGAFAQTNASGIATLSVGEGTYEVGADAPGMPPSTREIANVASGNASVTLRMVKSSTTIAGSILDDSGNGIKYAHVGAERRTLNPGATDACNFSTSRPSGGFSDTPTDENGNYTLYVANGTYCIRAWAPSYGEVGNRTVTMSGTSLTGQDIQASAGNYATISGVVCKGGSVVSNACSPATSGVSGAFLNCFSSGSGGNGTQSGSLGAYSLKVKLPTSGTATYTCDGFAPGIGPLGRQTTTLGGGTSTAIVNFALSNTQLPGTITVTATGLTEGFCDARTASGTNAGTGAGAPIQSGIATINVPAGTYSVRCGSPKTGPLTLTPSSVTLTASGTAAVVATVPTTRSITGAVTAGGSNLEAVTLSFTERSTGRAFTFTTGSQTTGSSNLSATGIPDGTYNVKASKKGFEAATGTATVAAGSTTVSALALTPTTTDSGQTVSIPVQESSVAYTGEASVIATKDGKTVVGEIDATTGNASLDLSNGTWTVKAIGDNGKESSTSTVVVAGGVVSGSTPTLSLATEISGYTAKNESETLSLSAGGLLKFEELSVGGTAPEVNVPSSTLSTNDSSTGKVEMKSDATLAGIDPGADSNFVGSSGYDITPTDANGNEVSDISGTVTITMPYTDAQVASAGVDESELMFASFDTSSQTWETFSTTVDTVNNVLTASVTHFSSFGIIGGVTATQVGSSASDFSPPAAPSNVRLASNGTSVTLTWTDPGDSDFYRIEVLRNEANGSEVTGDIRATVAKGDQRYVDTSVQAGKTYKYILKARDTALNQRLSDEYSIVVTAAAATSSGSSGTSGAGASTGTTTTTTPPASTTTTTPPASSSATTTTTTAPSAYAAPVARLIHDPSKLTELLAGLSQVRKQSEEAKYMPLIKSDAIAFKVGLTAEQEAKIVNFVSYGNSTSTVKLGAGERRALIRDYLETVGRSDVNHDDLHRMAAGEKPMGRNLAKERAQASAALKIFVKIYGHAPVYSVHQEDLAWNTLLYRIRFDRDLTKEKEGITEFRAVFGRSPKTPMDWATVRVLGYVKM